MRDRRQRPLPSRRSVSLSGIDVFRWFDWMMRATGRVRSAFTETLIETERFNPISREVRRGFDRMHQCALAEDEQACISASARKADGGTDPICG